MPATQNQLLPNESLSVDQYLSSSNGWYSLTYQSDGNLVLYKNYKFQARRTLWASQTAGQTPGICIMQADGNLVIYNPNRVRLWASDTATKANARLILQDDGNAVIYSTSGAPEWATNTAQEDHEQKGECLLLEQHLGFSGTHAALLHTEKVLFFSYDDHAEDDPNKALWRLWDLKTENFSIASAQIGRNLFCSGHCFLPDGRLLVAGGQSYNIYPFTGRGGDHDIHTFDPLQESWTRHSDMPAARYYPTCATLTDGNALIVSGAASRYTPIIGVPAANVPNDEYELFYPSANTLSSPARFNPGHMIELYPFVKLLPDGSQSGVLFVFSKNEARLFALDKYKWNSAQFKTHSSYSRTYPHQGSCVLLPLLPGEGYRARVLVIGGAGESSPHGHATDSAEIFEFDAQNPANSRWRQPIGGNMHNRRFMSDSVLLVDGTVLVLNGAAKGTADDSHEPVLQTELFDPVAESWKIMAPINHMRLYHSSALLLPDGRVLVAGNTRHWNPANEHEDPTIELFSPPYLFQGQRPVISSSPGEVTYGQDFVVETSDPTVVKSVVFIKQSSVTHTNNMDQRYIELVVKSRNATSLVVEAPPYASLGEPGFYMLFLLAQTGVPSIAKFIRLALPIVSQSDWRWCHKCNGLFWAAGEAAIGKCPAGDKHEKANSGNYTLINNSPSAPGQHDWRWCHKCNGLFWAANVLTIGKCPGGGKHERAGSADYTLIHDSPGANGQNDWRWCHKCNGLFWAAGEATIGRCPAGGKHDKAASSDYTLQQVSDNWTDHPNGRLHTDDGDVVDYTIEQNAVGQDIVEFVLSLGAGVTWKKELNLPDGHGSAWDIVAEGAGGSNSNSLWAHQVGNGQSLTFRKAKDWGRMTAVHSLSGLSGLSPGCRVRFTWVKD